MYMLRVTWLFCDISVLINCKNRFGLRTEDRLCLSHNTDVRPLPQNPAVFIQLQVSTCSICVLPVVLWTVGETFSGWKKNMKQRPTACRFGVGGKHNKSVYLTETFRLQVFSASIKVCSVGTMSFAIYLFIMGSFAYWVMLENKYQVITLFIKVFFLNSFISMMLLFCKHFELITSLTVTSWHWSCQIKWGSGHK